MDNYTILGRIGEGAHGIVFKAKKKQSGEVVALKKIALRKLEDGVPNTVIREIKALQQIEHPNVVRLYDVFPSGAGFVLVFEFMLTDLSEILRNSVYSLTKSHVKMYMLMLLKGISYCHKRNLMHRDLKPANLLIALNGELKIADFGLARVYMHNESGRQYSHQVATRWYRAPELLYGSRSYGTGVDLWAIGAIFGELLNNSPLFPGESDIEQLCCVLKALGTPNEEIWPGLKELPDYNKITFPENQPVPMNQLVPDASEIELDLLQQFLVYDSKKRILAKDALLHPFFFTEPLPAHHSEIKLAVPDLKNKNRLGGKTFDVTIPVEKSLVSKELIAPYSSIFK
ncbi:cyclin-dependent kinase 20-like [Clytia hemisphaerica]|uniref:cyclin-dependent kinase 20-like n=1 Tax=Clytia hemisphaerica TaxID=252671 RepID=UPI0034D4BF0F